MVKNSEYDGFANIAMNRGGVITSLQAAQCDANPDHYMQYGISIKAKFNVGDIITATGTNSVFLGGLTSAKALTLYIARLGA